MATVERAPGSVEAMQHLLSYLVSERHRLRAHGADSIELDANLKAIVAIRSHLGRALTQAGRLTEDAGHTC
jgi:hypothetical protein